MSIKISRLTKMGINKSLLLPKNTAKITKEEIMGRAVEHAVSGPKTTKINEPVPMLTKEQIQKNLDYFNRNFNPLWQK